MMDHCKSCKKMNFVASSYKVGNNLRANIAKNKYIYCKETNFDGSRGLFKTIAE